MMKETRRRKNASFARDIAVAVGFLTVIPVSESAWSGTNPTGRSFSWFPLAGLIIGGILTLAALVLTPLLPAGVVAALLLALWISLTGGLHLDGLMDSCDGLLSAKSPQERLVVMRDSRVGAFGALGALSTLIVKFSALSYLMEIWIGAGFTAFAALICAPVLGRWAMTFVVVKFPYHAHGETLGASFTRGAGVRQLLIASVSVALILALILFWIPLFSGDYLVFAAATLAALAVALAVASGVAWFAVGRIGGMTGDVYGAVCEMVEVAVLLVWVSCVFIGAGGA